MKHELNAPVDLRLKAEIDLPFRMLYHETKLPEHELPDHFHDWHELICVHQGEGKMLIDHSIVDIQAGSLIIIPGNTLHRTFQHVDNPLTSSAFYISPVLFQGIGGEAASIQPFFERSRKTRSYIKKLTYEEQVEIEQWIEQIYAETISQLHLRTYATLLLLQLMLISLIRMTEVDEPSKAPLAGPLWMSHVLQQLDHQIHLPVSLSTLAKDASISVAHFSRAFKQHTGMTLTEYVAARRIILSKEKLVRTDDTMVSIAEACGFVSLPHFYRLFKKHTGTTPSSYRKMMR
ncbi:AraC family transcriptional regulator [Paenibacillus sp. Marseille-Q4541]|uniref:AraC family transcriptional regulator n=1 Tax=Paenibacillus sp. Marseille-Q4541 TaxID=2831522 RepID=UPI001BA62643|nr:AraC family transcriptional regulator [Paenibacillus sp. Marseille-Q4541]